MMKHLGSIGTCAALAALLIVFSGSAIAGDAFAAGSAQISEFCHFQFFASDKGGNVTEQCNFPEPTGRQLFVGPVVCFAAEGNIATFVWLMQIAPESEQGKYQQVFVVEEGAPGHDVPDRFHNYGQSGYNPCTNGISAYDPGAHEVEKGNFVVKEGKEDTPE